MKSKNEKGFSLVELLLVVVIIGVIAALAVPALRKALIAAESGTTFATMRTISSAQVNFFSANGRFGNLTEINTALSGGIGRTGGNQVFRKSFTFDMVPATPTPAELREGYTITATRTLAADPLIYQYKLTQSGEIEQILP